MTHVRTTENDAKISKVEITTEQKRAFPRALRVAW